MTRRKTAVLSAVALGALGLFMLASIANASHPRPKGATPLRVSMVPAFAQVHRTEPDARAAAGVPVL